MDDDMFGDAQDTLNAAARGLEPPRRKGTVPDLGAASAAMAKGNGGEATASERTSADDVRMRETAAALEAERLAYKKLLDRKKTKAKPPTPFVVPAEHGKPSYLAVVKKGKLVPVAASKASVPRPRT